MDPDRINQLRPRERDCLRLVSRGYSSKEIAKELGISRHTVDDHLKQAIATLGVSSRFEAGRLFAASEAGAETPPQRLGTQSPDLAPTGEPPAQIPPDRLGTPFFGLGMPIRRKGVRGNDLTTAQRLGWILIGAVLLLFGLAQLANMMEVVEGIARGR